MTKIDWKDIETTIMHGCGGVEFIIEGRKVTLYRHIDKGRVKIAVYIDGYIRGCNISEEFEGFDPFIKKVGQKREKFLHSKKMRDKMVKFFGKREAIKEGAFKKYVTYSHIWSSFSALKRAFSKLEDIEVIK